MSNKLLGFKKHYKIFFFKFYFFLYDVYRLEVFWLVGILPNTAAQENKKKKKIFKRNFKRLFSLSRKRGADGAQGPQLSVFFFFFDTLAQQFFSLNPQTNPGDGYGGN